MPCATIVVERPHDCPWPLDGHRVITMDHYARDPNAVPPGSRIVNLCRNGYLSRGYYCSLLGEARGHAVLPSVATLVRLNSRTLHGPALDRLNRALAIVEEEQPDGIDLRCSLPVFFGRATDPRLQRLAALAFELFPSPLLILDFDGRTCQVKGVRPVTGRDVRHDAGALFQNAMERWLSSQRPVPPRHQERRPHLAILHDPADPLPPSRPKTLEHFRRVGAELGVEVKLIHHRDADRLRGFDALFIRETTAIMHPSFRLASMAEEMGMPVIDDPQSILRCCNKVYLAEMLRRNGVPAPRTAITDGRDLHQVAERLGYPVVLKAPDGCSSRGVFKAETPAELARLARPLLAASHLILAQEYVYTPFDWRVTVLAGRPLFACRYRMADGHWQIFRHGAGGQSEEGATECVAVEAVPPAVTEVALRAAALIGDGLYGVDVKETEAGVRVIEVNDCPNIDADLEDAILGEDLYRTVIRDFLRRISEVRQTAAPFVAAPPRIAASASRRLRIRAEGATPAAQPRLAAVRRGRT